MTDWRSYGDVDIGIWRRTLHDARSPLEAVATEAYDAASPHTGLALAMLRVESQFGVAFNANSVSNRNYLNLRPPDADGYLRFDSAVDGIRAWRDRITSPTYKNAIYANTVTIADLIHVFASSSDGNNEQSYVRSIEADLARWGVVPTEATPVSTLTFGRVPYPEVIQSHLPASNPYVQEGGAPSVPEAIFWHRMVGTLLGTDEHFSAGNAATCYGVGVQAVPRDAANNQAGVIYEWIKPGNGWYGESSGPVKVPYGDGLIYANEVGTENVNRLSKAIEISGDVDTPLDEKARDAIAAMTAYWADRKVIPWNEFPLYKAKGRSYVIWHNEITGLAYKTCPGAVVMAGTPALIERTKQIMKQYQEGAVPDKPKYTEPLPVPFEEGDYGWHKLNDIPFFCLEAEVEIVRNTRPKAWADGAAPDAGPMQKKGEKVKIKASGANRNKKGQLTRWNIRASDGARISGSACSPALPYKP